ncbi:MAG TPA: hypothetical protein VIF09_21250 [Polyangiaceae bacterium]
MRAAVLIVLVGATGCGLDMAGLAYDFAGAEGGVSTDAGSSDAVASMGEGGSEDGVSTDGPAPYDAPIGSCVAGVPAGWSLVAYETSRGGCPAGYGPSHDEVAGATAGTGACTCSCNITSSPSCTSGTLLTGWSTGGGPVCPNVGTSIGINGTGCTQMQGQLAAGFSAQALPLTGGVCSGSAVGDTTKVSKTEVRTCAVPAANAEALCGGAAPGGFFACIMTAGDAPCPGGPFTNRSVLADDETLVCTACSSCTVTGTCSGAKMTFFGDSQCTPSGLTLPCDGSCAPTGSQSQGFSAFEYTAQVHAACSATSPAGPTFQPVNPSTVCCR